MVGFIYIFTNESMPSMLKIGFTQKLPDERAKELSTTASPTPFKVEYALLVNDPERIEKEIHQKFSDYRVSGNREFFRMELNAAEKYISDTYDGKQQLINKYIKLIDDMTDTLGVVVKTKQSEKKDLLDIIEKKSKECSLTSSIVNNEKLSKIKLIKSIIEKCKIDFDFNSINNDETLKCLLSEELSKSFNVDISDFNNCEVDQLIDSEMLKLDLNAIEAHHDFMKGVYDKFKDASKSSHK